MSESQCLMLSFPSGPEAGVRGTRDKTLTWCGKPSTDTDQSHIFFILLFIFYWPIVYDDCLLTCIYYLNVCMCVHVGHIQVCMQVCYKN